MSNTPPTIASIPGLTATHEGDLDVYTWNRLENPFQGEVFYNPSVIDPDPGQTFTWSIVPGGDAALFNINPSTGSLSWVTPPDYENPTDVGLNNTQEVTIQVDDGNGGVDQQKIIIGILDSTADNPPPATPLAILPVLGTDVTHQGDLDVYSWSRGENPFPDEVFYNPSVSNPDPGQTLTWSIVPGGDAALFNINPTTGSLSWVTPPDYENPTDVGLNNTQEVTIQVDGSNGQTDQQKVIITIQNENEAPTFDFPVDRPFLSVSLDETTAQYPAVAGWNTWDPEVGLNSPTVNVTVGGEDATLFEPGINPQTIKFINPVDFENPGSSDGDNTYEITFTADDGQGGIAVQEVNITITDDVSDNPPPNTPPTITTINASGGGTQIDSVSWTDGQANFISDPVATDPNAGQTLTWSIEGGADADRFFIGSGDNGVGFLNWVTPPDFDPQRQVFTDGNGRQYNNYYVTLQVDDGNGGIDTQPVTVSAYQNPWFPGIYSGAEPTAVNVDENTTAVTTVAAQDTLSSFTYSIDPNVGDADKFTVDQSGVVSFISAPDYENPTDAGIPGEGGQDGVYDVAVLATDNLGGVASQALRIFVQDDVSDNPPPNTPPDFGGEPGGMSTFENQPGERIHWFTATDPDPGQTLTYSIVEGVGDADDFDMDPVNGYLTFKTTPDYENPTDSDDNNSYSVQVKVDDGNGGTDTRDFTVNVLDNPFDNPPPNTPPTFVDGTELNLNVDENTSGPYLIQATDPDPGQTLTYSIVDPLIAGATGADADKFTIDPATGILNFIMPTDFENPTDSDHDNVYSVVVQVDDGNGGVATLNTNIHVHDVNDAPVPNPSFVVNIAKGEVLHGTVGGDVPVEALATDADSTLTAASFTAIDATYNGVTVTLADAGLSYDPATGNFFFDFRAPLYQSIAEGETATLVYHHTVSDGIDTVDGYLTYNVSGTNQPPVPNPSLIIDVSEDQVLQGIVGGDVPVSALATDVDSPNLTAASFAAIDATYNGNVVTLAEAGLSYDPQTGQFVFDFSVPLYQSLGDGETATLVYHETVSDAANTVDGYITYNITGVNDAPNISTVNVSGGGTQIDSVGYTDGQSNYLTNPLATDPDAGQTLTWSIVGGADADKFTISSGSGDGLAQIFWVTPPDFDPQREVTIDGGGRPYNNYHVTIQVDDGNGGIDTQDITVGVAQNPWFTSFDGATGPVSVDVNENTTTVATVTAQDNLGSFTYAIDPNVGDADKFTVDQNGVVSFITAPDYENPTDVGTPGEGGQDGVYDVAVLAIDNGGGGGAPGSTSSQALRVFVQDVFENSAPTITTINVNGGSTQIDSVGYTDGQSNYLTNPLATDPDAGQTLTWSIVGGADSDKFTISSGSGDGLAQIFWVTPPDFDPQREVTIDGGGRPYNNYHVTIQVDDGNGGIDTQDITVGVAQNPWFTSFDGATGPVSVDVNENTTTVATVTAQDNLGSFTYAIDPNVGDADKFTVDQNGVVSFITAPDYENPTDVGTPGEGGQDGVYDVAVLAIDNGGGGGAPGSTSSQALRVTVTNDPSDDNTPPEFDAFAGLGPIHENTTAVGTVHATDIDPGQTVTYSISPIAGDGDSYVGQPNLFQVDALTGELSFINAPDYENPQDTGGIVDNIYDVWVKADDGNGGAAYQKVTVQVLDEQEITPPAGTNNTVSVVEDVSYTLKETDFGFTDGDDHNFTGVLINTLPSSTAGVLRLGNTALSAGAFVTAQQIASGMLIYTPRDNVFGNTADTSFTFSVRDDGPAGLNQDTTPNTLSIDMSTTNFTDYNVTREGGSDLSITFGLIRPNFSVYDYDSDGDGFDIITLDTAAGGATTFTDLNFTRTDNNLEVTWDLGASPTTMTVRDQYVSATAWEQIRFDNGATYAGYSLAAGTANIGGGIAIAGGRDVLAGTAASEVLNGLGGPDLIFGNGGDDVLTGGAGGDLLELGLGSDTANVSSGESAGVVNTASGGSISGYDVIVDFNPETDKLNLNGVPFEVSASDTNGLVDGANSTLTIGGTPISQHSIADGVITFYDGGGSLVSLASNQNVAAAVQYLHNNDLGGSKTTVAFDATLTGTPHTFVFQQVGETQSATNDILIDLNGLTAADLLQIEVTPPDNTAPDAPVISGIAPDSGTSVVDGLTKVATVTVSGTAEADSAVAVFNGDAQIGTATADENGNWSLADVELSEGANSLTATATDAAGNTGAASGAFVATLDTISPDDTSFIATDPTLTDASTLHYTVTFTEPVTGVDASHFTLITSGVSGASIASVTEVSGSNGTQYAIEVNAGTGDGTVKLNFVSAGVEDLAGNQLPGGSYQLSSGYQPFLHPAALAIGDVNGDGAGDLVVANTGLYIGGNAVSVQLGNGDGTFQSPTTYATGTSPFSVALDDLNGDGKLDVVTANADSNSVSVLIGNGDGTLQSQVTYATQSYPNSVATGDVNGDGSPDLVVGNHFGGISVLLGNGDGTFQSQATYGTPSSPYSIATADLNGDGYSDIVSANPDSNTMSVLLANSDGSFQPQTSYATESGPRYFVALGDVNGDAVADLVAAGAQISVQLGNGDGTFGASVDYGPSGGPVAVADANGDGDADIISGGELLLGNGDGTFQSPVQFSDSGYLAVGDVNGDGRPDVALAHYNVDSLPIDTVSVLLNTPQTIDGPTYTIDRSAPTGWQFSLANSNFDGASSIAAGTILGNVSATGEANPGVTYYFATDAAGAGATQTLSGLSIDASTGVISTTAAISSSSSTWLVAEDAVGNKFAQQFNVGVGTSAANNVAVAAGTTVTFGLGGVDTVTGTSGGDAISGGSGNDTLNGGTGNDSLNGGVGNDTLNGGADSDILLGGVGNDVLHGDDGDDTIAIAGTDAQGDTFDGGSGSDTILVTGSTDVTLASFDAAASSIENWQGNGQGIIGTGAANTINLGGLTTIAGLAYVDGGSGNDVIIGSNLNDDLRGGVGNDALNGLAGNDTLSGGAGNDALSGGDGDDVLVIAGTEAQGDTLDGGTGTDTIAATGATDVTLTSLDTAASSIETWQGNGLGILGTGAANTINLSNLGAITGLSYVDGAGGDDIITGSNLADDLRGGSANDTLSGLGGNDILTGGAGNDTVAGGEGDDTISVAGTDAQGDSFDGGAGSDEIFVTGAADLTLANFNAATSSIERWRGNGKALIGNSANNAFDLSALVAVASLLYVDGSSGNDFIIGTALADVSDDLRGGTGDDNISGLAGNDVINGGVGNDTLSGGDGDDTFLIAGTEARGDAIDGGSGLDKILVSGTADVSLTSFDAAASSIEAWQGNGAAIVGTTAADTINLSGLTSVSGLSFLDGGGGDDLLTGTNFADDLRGGAGNDTLTGLAGNDVLNGGAGNDTLSGGDGNDTLIGGAGNDVQLGGDGDDTFVIAGTDAQADTIDGGIGADAISVTGAGNVTLSNFNASTSSIELWQGNGQGVVATGAADSINIGGLTSVSGLTFIDGGGGNDAITGTNLAPVSDDLRGGAGNDSLSGLAGNDTLNGAAGDDTLNGGIGADTLTGGTGKDVFVYLSANDVGDTMIGFVVADDTIQISAAGFGGGLVAGQQLVTGASFISSTDPLATTAAGTFLYDSDGHDLLWDADGSASGAALQVAHFDTAVALKADDFDIVA